MGALTLGVIIKVAAPLRFMDFFINTPPFNLVLKD